MSEPPVPLDLAFDAPAEAVVRLSPLVRRIVAPNPGPLTFKGTNTYIVGHGEVAVIDPGPESPAHIDALLDALGPGRVAAIVVTHTHRDHSPGAHLLKARTGAPIIGCGPYRPAREPLAGEIAAVRASNDLDYRPDRLMADGDVFEGEGFRLVAVATPGHTMNHLAFALPEEQALFSGDHVMAWSTTVVAPPSGSMTAYLASLEACRRREDKVYWPGHGGPVADPPRFVRALQHHRRQREQAILRRLQQGDATASAIVAAIYERLDPRLERAAALSVLAHLEDLCTRGKATRDGEPGIAARFAAAA